MKSVLQKVLVPLLVIAVMVYTYINYRNGGASQLGFLVCMVLLGYVLISMVLQIIRDLRNR